MPEETPSESRPRRRRGEVTTYDFRRPNKFSRDHLRALQLVADNFSRQISTSFATTLRTDASTTLDAVEQLTYEDFEANLASPGVLTVVSADPLPGVAMLAIAPNVALGMVDRIVGGPGEGGAPRALTEIERGLMKTINDHILDEFASAFNIAEIRPKVVTQESNPLFAQIAKPSDMTVVITIDVTIAHEQGTLQLCLPWEMIGEALDAHLAKAGFGDRRDREAQQFRETLDTTVRAVPVDIAVRFRDVILTSEEIVGLQVGDIVSLHHPVSEPLTGLVDDVPCFTAITGRKGRKLACLVVGITDGGPA